MRKRAILFLQYTNPRAYPPLEHASFLLADRGWNVTFLGVRRGYSPAKKFFPPHPGIQVFEFPPCGPGWLQKLHFLAFCLWACFMAVGRGGWVYVSDPLATPAGLALVRVMGFKGVYHEHDTPSGERTSLFSRLIGSCRARMARAARVRVLPNADRARLFEAETGCPATTVWNCPSVGEARTARSPSRGRFWAYYQGSVVPDRLPLAVVDAMRLLPDSAGLRICGYETIGHPGYVSRILARAAELGLGERVRYVGAAPNRKAMLDWARQTQVGLSFMPKKTSDVNMRHMTGASNKPFEYLACGLALLVSDLDEWKRFFVDPGYGRACDPENPESIAAELRWFIDHPEETAAMGERGRQKVLAEWNYEQEFAKILKTLESEAG